LAVDDLAGVDVAHAGLQLVEYDCSEEVGAGGIAQTPLDHLLDRLPQRQPVRLLLPNIGALEERNDQPEAGVEDVTEALLVGVHVALPQVDCYPLETAISRRLQTLDN
jgi:hypothetical protein